MLLRWRCWICCYVEDAVTLKMLLRWRCCYVEVFVTLEMLKMLKMLLRWRCWICCYVEDVVTCCYVEDVVDFRLKKTDAHFVHGFLEDHDISRWSRKALKFYPDAITMVRTKLKLTLDDTSQRLKTKKRCFFHTNKVQLCWRRKECIQCTMFNHFQKTL